MTAASLFSGVGAPELAMPGWQWLWHAEIEKFPSAVMAERFPHSVNLGDVTADDFIERALDIGRPDVLVFGSPCQSYSVAGKRLGLDDPRGNLALVALRIIAAIKPRWFLFENVPGLLSSSSGSDFGIFLRTVEECGYSLCWSVLDAQYFGLAQRRKRVFAVASAGDWRGPAAILLEPESLCGDSPTRHETGQEVTGTLESRATSGGFGTDFSCLGGLQVAGALGTEVFGSRQRCDASDNLIVSNAEGSDGFTLTRANIGKHVNNQTPLLAHAPVSFCLNAGGMGRIDAETETLITHALRGDGFHASEDGTGRGTPLVPAMVPVAFAHQGGRTQTTMGYQPESGTTPALSVGQTVAIAFSAKDHGSDAGEMSPTLRAGGHSKSHANGGCMPAVLTTGVRRLMPVECERLQGMPDQHTAVTYRGKPAADGPRYKAIGNSMAVPVVRWILSRLEIVDGLLGGH